MQFIALAQLEQFRVVDEHTAVSIVSLLTDEKRTVDSKCLMSISTLDAMVAAQEVFIWLDPNLPAEERLKAMSKLAKNLRRHPNPSSLSHGLLDAHPRSPRESGSYSFMGEPDYVSDSVKLEFHVTR